LIVIEYLATTTLEIRAIGHSWDKANHFIAFFSLYVTLYFSYKNITETLKIFYLFLFGLQIEIVQAFIPNRYFSTLDIFADIIGIFIAYLFIKVLVLFIQKYKNIVKN